jgi:phospholipid/cholesterol/gamma-HCH transport system substrate-binding protein
MFKLSNESKIALLAIAAVAIGFWGFKFLKGINVLTASKTYYVRYNNVDQLRPSSPVFIKGFQVGMVKDMYIDEKDDKTIIVVLNIDRGVDIPKDATAAIIGLSLMGGKAVEIVINQPCEGDDCAQSGEYLRGSSKSFLESVMGAPDELDAYTSRLQKGLVGVWDSIADPNDPRGAGRSILALEHSLLNIEKVTSQLSAILAQNQRSLSSTFDNTAELTQALSANSKDISNTLANLSAISDQLKGAGFDKSTIKATQAIDSITQSLTALRGTLATTSRTISRVDTLAQNMVRGEGLVGKTLTDEELYDNLTRTTRHLQLLMQDLRLNPKRYTTVKLKVFGKNKTKSYVNPIDDPAYQMLVDSLERAYSRKIKN